MVDDYILCFKEVFPFGRQARSGMPEEVRVAREAAPPDLLADVTDALRATADEWISSLNSVGQGWFSKPSGHSKGRFSAHVSVSLLSLYTYDIITCRCILRKPALLG